MRRTPATGAPADICPALPEDAAPALEAYLRACGVTSLILVSIQPGDPGGPTTDVGGFGDGSIHLEHWPDIPRARAALTEHPAVAEVADGPTTGSSICWSLSFTLKAPGRTLDTPPIPSDRSRS
jgi:hypothetical protein